MGKDEWKMVTQVRKSFSKPLWILQETVSYGYGNKQAEIKFFYLSLVLNDMKGESHRGTSHLLLVQELF